MSVLHVEGWSVDQVADWIAGLDESLTRYGEMFIARKVDGQRLLNLMAGDLAIYGVDKIGDQVLLADAIQNLRNELESDRVTLQTLASNVAVRSKTYRSQLTSSREKKRISNESLASASFLLDAGKALARWLTRFPFVGVEEYDEITRLMTKHLFELAMLSQRDLFADNAIEEVQYLCTKIIELCDDIITSKDSLTIQPAAVDVITIRKRHEQEWGLQYDSSYFGIHTVSGVNLSSPAHQSGHLERGDEILQVNYQTVVGWTQDSVYNLLHENPTEVILTLKRRPRHASNSLGHMYLRPSKLPSRSSKSKLVPPAQFPILETDTEDVEEDTPSREKTPSLEAPEMNMHSPTDSAAEARFRKLYPKPKNILRRRASVTGSSPTSTRPPVTFTNDESIQAQNSSSSSAGTRHKLDKCVSAPERNKLEKQSQVEEALRLFVGDLNIRGSRVTLPCPAVGNTLALPDLLCVKPIIAKSGEDVQTKAKDSHGYGRSEDEGSSDEVFESSEQTTIIDAVVKTKKLNGQGSEELIETALVEKTAKLTVTIPAPVPKAEEDTGPPPPPRPAKPEKKELVKAVLRYPPIPRPRTASPPKTLNARTTHYANDTKFSSPSLVSSSSFREDLRRSLPPKPQSLINIASAAQNESGYTGYLHQRQPHWKFGGPRWTRCRATIDGKYFRLMKPELLITIDGARVTRANEVHSRPFAFKIEDKYDKSSVHYFAAESQQELSVWLEYLGASDLLNQPRGSVLNRSMSVQPDPARISSPIPVERHRRLSLPHSQHKLQNQMRGKLYKQNSTSGALTSAGSATSIEDKVRFWNSSPSPTHKSNISSITITTSSRRSQQNELAKKKYFESSRLGNRQSSVDNHLLLSREHDPVFDGSKPTTPVKRTPDSPSKKYKMGAAILLRRKGSDSTNNNDMCTACGRNFSTRDSSTQTDEVILVFSELEGQHESRI